MTEREPAARWLATGHLGTRVLAGWFGALAMVNAVGALRHPGFDENTWWVDVRGLPGNLEHAVLFAAGAGLLGWAVRPRSGWLAWFATVSAGVLAVVAILDAVRFYRLWGAGTIAPRVVVPLSVIVSAVLILIAVMTRRPAPPLPALGRAAVLLAVSALFVVAVPLTQMSFFGTTDYRRPADAIVVFGARVLPDGTASIALADRVATAVELYQEGLAGVIVMSGGIEPDPGFDETAVMADLATSFGVPGAAIVRDPEGVSTDATVANTARMACERGWTSLLAVSHFYHLPRIELAFAREGVRVATVPARESRQVPQTRGNAAREIPALWAYYLRAVID